MRGKNDVTYLLLYTYLLQGLSSLIFIASSLLYFFDCFPLVFLDVHYPALSSEKIETISLCLALIIQEFSALSISTVFLTKTSSWSFFKYSSFLLFFSASTLPLFSLLLYFGFSSLPHFLYCLLKITSFCCLFWAGPELLLLLMLLLHFLILQFQHF